MSPFRNSGRRSFSPVLILWIFGLLLSAASWLGVALLFQYHYAEIVAVAGLLLTLALSVYIALYNAASGACKQQ